LSKDLNYASTAYVEAKKTYDWTHSTIDAAAQVRRSLNATKLADIVGTVWNLMEKDRKPVPANPKYM